MGSVSKLNPEHWSTTAEHYTPEFIADRVRLVMGGIHLDPASCHEANLTVRATRYFSKDDDGLSRPWTGSVFCNPPGDKSGKLIQKFWRKLHQHVCMGDVEQFTWLAFNVSHLRTLQTPGVIADLLEECDVCVPSSRIRFTGNSPTKDNAILYWGPNRRAFYRHFRSMGVIWRGVR